MPKSKGYHQHYYKVVKECGTCHRIFNSDKLFELHKKVTHNTTACTCGDPNCDGSMIQNRCHACGFTSDSYEILKKHQKKCDLCSRS